MDKTSRTYSTSLKEIAVDPLSTSYSSWDGALFNISRSALLEFPGGKAGTYTVPGTVAEIAPAAFMESANLTSVTIPNSVTNIGAWAFEGCTGLSRLTIPGGVRSLGAAAFARRSGLRSDA